MNNRTRYSLRLFVWVLVIPAFGIMLAAVADEDEQKVANSELPAAIQHALIKLDADDYEVDVKTEDGQRVYEVEIEEDGVEIELKLAEDGRLLGVEVEEEKGDNGKDDD